MKFKVKYNPHLDLVNLAQYQLENIEKKYNSINPRGLGLDMKACLISFAFLAESLINIAGFGLYGDKFKEKKPYHLKRKEVFKELKVSHIEGLESVLNSLQSARNYFAHAKPERYDFELKQSENESAIFDRPTDKLLNLEFLKHANNTLEELLNVISSHESIEEYGLITSAVESGS